MRRLCALLLVAVFAGCVGDNPSARRGQRYALFVGVDVSGSFYNSPEFTDALEFLARYIHGALSGAGGKTPPKELFVGVIGGQVVSEAKSFHPIHDFSDKTVEQIQADLKSWLTVKPDGLSDFSIFFQQVAEIANKRNMALLPISILVISDGVPALPGKGSVPDIGDYGKIDLSPIEYLSRNVTVRLLYPNPVVASKWEKQVQRQRARMWTVDNVVMAGWRHQLQAGLPPEQQNKLWKWVEDNVDYRVRVARFSSRRSSARGPAR